MYQLPAIEHIVFDTETTGLDAKSDRILEVAAIRFDPRTGELFDNLHLYINPGMEVSEESAQVHGLTNEFLADKPPFADVVDQILDFCADRAVVIHNAPFDTRMMDEELKRLKRPKFGTVPRAIEDTLSISRKAVKAKKHTLDVLCDRFGVDRSVRTLHGALVDCELLARVYPHLKAEYERVLGKLSELLSRPIGAPLPDGLEDRVTLVLELKTLISVLENEEKRVTEGVRELVQGLDTASDGWRVRFAPSTSTDWKKISEKFLEGLDLKPFQTPGSKMYVERLD